MAQTRVCHLSAEDMQKVEVGAVLDVREAHIAHVSLSQPKDGQVFAGAEMGQARIADLGKGQIEVAINFVHPSK